MLTKWILSALLLVSATAQAGVLIEPYVGYLALNTSGKIDNPPDTGGKLESNSVSGAGFGGRIGYGIANLGLAFDYMTANVSEDKMDNKMTNMGIVGMASIPFFRFWAGYIFSAKYEVNVDDTPELSGTESGKGFKLGVGINPLPLLSINLEYLMLSYDKEEYRDFENLDRETKGVMLSVSMPLVF